MICPGCGHMHGDDKHRVTGYCAMCVTVHEAGKLAGAQAAYAACATEARDLSSVAREEAYESEQEEPERAELHAAADALRDFAKWADAKAAES